MHATRRLRVGLLFACFATLFVPFALEAQRSISPGQYLAGRLDTNSHRFGGVYYEDWYFQGRSGQTVTIRLDSDDFDAYLQLGFMQNGGFEEIATDDDGGEGLNALLQIPLTRTGRYAIRARALSQGYTGSYRVGLSGGAPPVASISIGSTRSGALSAGDAVDASGYPHDVWTFQGSSGDEIV